MCSRRGTRTSDTVVQRTLLSFERVPSPLTACRTANRQKVKGYLTFLHGIGYRGWRFDMVKGYSPSFVGDYVAVGPSLFYHACCLPPY